MNASLIGVPFVELSKNQKKQYIRDGYLVLPNAIPLSMVEAARQLVNNSLGEQGIDPALLWKFRSQSYTPEVQIDPVITDLFNQSTIRGYAESLIGKGNMATVGSAQVALRFPSKPFTDPKPPSGHLDGIGSGDNGHGTGTYTRGFTVLAVIYLQDVLHEYHGNFTVWPGSHITLADHLREVGLDVLTKGQPELTWPHPAVQITGKAGDVVLAHYNLIHTAVGNFGPDIRYAAISRVSHINMAKLGVQGFAEPWTEYEGLTGLLNATELEKPQVAVAGKYE
jgi:hypothetical protein